MSYSYVNESRGQVTGALGGMQNGAFITINNQYNSRLQPTLLSALTTDSQSASPTIISLSYSFSFNTASCSTTGGTSGNNGNVIGIINNRDNNRGQNFTYDCLNRISAGYSNGPSWGNQYTIDPWGNLTNKSAYTGKTNYESLNASATTQNRLTGFNYDAMGNMTQNGAQYFYDAENHMTSAGGGYSYLYDGDGNRVEKCTSGSTPGTCASGATGTLYWMDLGGNNIAESDLTGTMQEEYAFFGRRIARLDIPSGGSPSTANVHFYFADFLGSSSVVTNYNGDMKLCTTSPTGYTTIPTGEEESDFYPYGGEIKLCDTSPQHYKFTGKERDSESGLDEFGARYYANSLGRFMIPDWAGTPIDVPYANFGNPQSLNLYSYVENNPTTVGDPDGHSIWDTIRGVVAATASDVFGSPRAEGGNSDFKTGETIGDGATTVAGAYQTAQNAVASVLFDVGTDGVGTLAAPVEVASVAVPLAITGRAAGNLVTDVKQMSGGPKAKDASTVSSNGQAATDSGQKKGPSGNAMIHEVPSKNAAAAERTAKTASRGLKPIRHPNPKKGDPHFHSVDKDGKKINDGTHYTY